MNTFLQLKFKLGIHSHLQIEALCSIQSQNSELEFVTNVTLPLPANVCNNIFFYEHFAPVNRKLWSSAVNHISTCWSLYKEKTLLWSIVKSRFILLFKYYMETDLSLYVYIHMLSFSGNFQLNWARHFFRLCCVNICRNVNNS